MNSKMIVVLALVVLSSCMSSYCPTYSGTRRNKETLTASKKQKEVKNKTPYYKNMKRAEQD